MTTTTRDQNGKRITKSVHQDVDGMWWVKVWSGNKNVTNVREYGYRTRKQARNGDISDGIGTTGRIS